MFGWLKSSRQDEGSRFSDALNEAGGYRVDYGNWRPITLAGDPVMIGTMPRKEAVAVSRQLLGMADERAEAARDVLGRLGVSPGSDPHDWEQVETLLTRLAEPSLEGKPVSWNRTGLRPSYWAFLHDVAFLYARALIASRPGTRLVEAGWGASGVTGSLSPLPVLAAPDGYPVTPFEPVLTAGNLALTQGHSDLLPQGFAMLAGGADPGPREDAADWNRAFVAEEGRPPTADEIIDYMVENRLADDDLPPDLAARLADGQP